VLTYTRPSSPELGYSWVWTYGHLIPTAVLGVGAGLAAALGARWWVWAPIAVLGLWTFAGFLVMRLGMRMNQVPTLRVREFLADGAGSVLDVGCGSGRLSISIARARPHLTIVGLDNFSAGYIRGHSATNTERNFRLAGIAERATVRPGDMRVMPFADASFDAAASSAAIDHLEPVDLRTTLGEVHRVLKPGGQFLLLVTVPNVWLTIAFGPLIARRLKGREFWRAALTEAGLTIEQEGTVRTSALFLTRRS
jgi:SAM-dependent methyltransferase